MKKTLRQVVCIAVACMMVLGLFAGCAGKTGNKPAASSAPAAVTAVTYPLKLDKPLTLKYWVDLPADKVAPAYKNMGDTEIYKELEKRTGVKIEFLHPAAGQANEQFNLMCASRDLPDLIERDISTYPGGPEKAISDGIIIKHNDLIDRYAPDLKKLLTDNPLYAKLAKTDSGTIYSFPFIRGHEGLMVFQGPQVRQDWLDELGLKVPETMDDWYNVLKAFKEKKKVDFPLTFRQAPNGGNDIGGSNAFIGAFGIAKGFYVEDGKVKFGSAEPNYKQFLATFSKWYAEKLIDPDFPTMDDKAWRAKITSEKAGATVALVGGGMGYFYDNMLKTNPKFKLVAAPYPSLKAGDKVKFAQKDFPLYPNVSITTANKFPNESAMLMNYGYTKEGNVLFNFGVDGKSFTMVNNYPTYTEWIKKNPDGKPMSIAMSTWMRSHYSGPFVQRIEYFEQFLPYPTQIEAPKIWAKADPETTRLPRVTFTPEESSKIANLMTEINTYVDEMFLKFVMGQESLDKFDQYIDKVKKMNIEEALKIYQAALERYNKR